MGRYIGPSCRRCRRVGDKLMLKGERCASPKCALVKKSTKSGRRLPRRRKVSDRGLQLREKQKARYIYGLLERQFRRLFAEAEKSRGVTGETLLQLLERRLDNVVYRLGFAASRSQSRQIVRHGHIMVNGRKVNIPSYSVKEGDVIAWKERSTKTALYHEVTEGLGGRIVPNWLSLDKSTLTGKVVALPKREEIGAKFDDRVIVEYYSR